MRRSSENDGVIYSMHLLHSVYVSSRADIVNNDEPSSGRTLATETYWILG